RFFDALIAGDTAKAYQLWKPGPTYSMKDFLADWGPQGYFGPVKSYSILHAKAPKGSNAIAVSVEVSPFTPMPDTSDTEKSRRTKSSRFGFWLLTNRSASPFPDDVSCSLREMDSPWLSANVVQRVNKLLRADACRTKFAHDDSGGSVCEHGGIGERRTGRNRESQNTQNGIPRTRNVKDLPASGAALDSRLPYT